MMRYLCWVKILPDTWNGSSSVEMKDPDICLLKLSVKLKPSATYLKYSYHETAVSLHESCKITVNRRELQSSLPLCHSWNLPLILKTE